MVLRECITSCAHPDSVCSECDSEYAVWREARCRIRPFATLAGAERRLSNPHQDHRCALVSPAVVSPPVPLT
eukprot:1011304-Prymnesium_polylepis.1